MSEVQWGSGTGRVGPGDTLWLAGGSYSSGLTIGASGTSGSPIAIKRARASDSAATSASGWSSSFDSQVVIGAGGSCIYFNGGIGSYVTIDGQTPSGIKVNYRNGGRGVEMNGGSDFTNVTLKYIEAAGPGPITQTGDTRGFDLTTQANLTNLTLSHCEAHNSDTLVQVTRSTNLVIEYCDLHHAGAINAATYHPNTIYLGTVTNATIRYNKLHDIDVEGLFFGDPGNNGAQIYGNLFYQGSSPKNSGRGIEFDNSADTRNVLVYNNTFVDLPLAGVNFNNGKSHPGAVVKNNIFFNNNPNFGPASHDYNYFSGSNAGEAHGIGSGSAPFVNAGSYDYHLVSTIASNKPRDKGTSLGSPYNVDADGHTRGADGAWDIGAYEYGSGGTPPPANTAPTISSLPNQTTISGDAVGPIAFTVSDAESSAGSLTLSGSSSNQTLVPNSRITFGGSASNRTVSVAPASGQTGQATITVTVSDGSASATETFTLTVNPATNTAPTISTIANQTTTSGTAVGPIGFTIGDAETSAGSLTLSGNSSNRTLVPTSGITFGGSGSSRSVTIEPASGQTGTATITVTVSDGTATANRSFTVTVDGGSANNAPTVSNISNQTTTPGVPVGPIGFTVGDAETAASNLTVSGSSSNQTLVPNSGIAIGGSGSYRTITLAPASGQTGTATITVSVSDGASTTRKSFTLTVSAGTNTPPTISTIADQTTTTGVAVGPIGFTISDAQTAAGSLTVSGSSSNQTLVPNSAVTFGGSGANRTVTVKPASGQTGTATITVTVSDGSGSSRTSFDVVVDSSTTAAPGLVAAYGFNENQGSTVADASGHGNAGQLRGATWTSTAKFGKALKFDGASSFVFVNASPSLNLGRAMTLEAWVYPTARQGGWRTIVQKEVDAYFLHASSNSMMHPAGGGTFDGNRNFVTSSAGISSSKWTHLAVTYDGTTIRLYVNGAQKASQPQNGTLEANDSGLRIGGNVPYGEYFKGMIDEVRVYNRALSASEIKSDMQTPVAAAATTPPPPATTTWSHVDVGNVGIAGSDDGDANDATFTVKGSGEDVWSTEDGFRYLYRQLHGDGVIEAQVRSIDNWTSPWAKAGVMIRESLAANARNAFVFVTPGYGVRAQARTTIGGPTSSTGTSGPAAPYWVRLTRTGDRIDAAMSSDGTNWNVVETFSLPMGADVYVGFAVTAHDNSSLTTGVFAEPFVQ